MKATKNKKPQKVVNLEQYIYSSLQSIEKEEGYCFWLTARVGRRTTTREVILFHEEPTNHFSLERATMIVGKILLRMRTLEQLPTLPVKISFKNMPLSTANRLLAKARSGRKKKLPK